MKNVVIIGAGQSAIQCITSLKKEGYDGSITLIGEENHLPYQRPPLSKAFLDNTIEKERLYFKKIDSRSFVYTAYGGVTHHTQNRFRSSSLKAVLSRIASS